MKRNIRVRSGENYLIGSTVTASNSMGYDKGDTIVCINRKSVNYGHTLYIKDTMGCDFENWRKVINTDMETKYYVVWIEGLDVKTGEKVKRLTDTGFELTTKMGDAMRIRDCDIHYMKDYMKRHGVADFVVNGNYTFIKTSYVPKGTLYKFHQI